MLEIDHISKNYQRKGERQPFQALAPCTATIGDGEFVSIVGPSGCGKTTILKIIQGLIKPSTGTVSLGGKTVTGPGKGRAMVFQAATLLPWFSVLKNVMFGLESYGYPKAEARELALQQLAMVGLADFAEQHPHELSGGMQQRVNLARAMAVKPDVLLMDEPYAALDPQTRDEMQEQLLEIWGQTSMTVVLITHQIDEAVYLADRVLVMSQRPGSIMRDIEVPFERPRGIELKYSAGFQEVVSDIWRSMRSSSGSSPRSEDSHV